jgi:autotransporter translocation and assembly factor TamB
MSDDEKPRRPWIRRAARGLLGLAAAATVFVLLLLLVLHAPPVQRALARTALEAASRALDCPVEAGTVRWNLFAGTLELREVSLRGTGERAGTEISFAHARVELSLRALLRGRVVVESALVEQAAARLALASDGRLLFPFDLPPSPDEAPAERPDVEVRAFRLAKGRLELTDRSAAGRRVDVGDVALEGSLDLRALASSGTLTLGGIDVSSAAHGPLRGSSLDARWKTLGESASATARLVAKEAGLSAELVADVNDLSGTPRWTATLTADGALAPLAERLAPDLGLAGKAGAHVAAAGAGPVLSTATVTARAERLTLFGQSFDTVDLAAELEGPRLRKATLEAASGAGRLRAEASGTVRPEPRDLRFSLRAERLPLARLLDLPARAPKLAGTLDGTVEGTLARPALAGLVASADLELREDRAAPRGTLAPKGRARLSVEKGIVTAESVELSERSSRASLSGAWDEPHGTIDAKLDVDSPDVGPWLALFGLEGKGALSAHLAGAGTLARPTVDGTIRARDLVVSGSRIDCVELDARANGTRFEATNGFVAAYDVTAGVEADGKLPLHGARSPEIDLRLRGVRFRGRPVADVNAHATLGATLDFRLATADGTVLATSAFPPRGGFRASVEVARFDLSLLGAFLPPHLADLEGAVTGRAEASQPRSGPLQAEARIDDALVAAGGRRISAKGIEASASGDVVEVASAELRGDDGSLLSLSGRGKLDGSRIEGRVRLEVPDLAAYAGLLPPPPEGEAAVRFGGRLTGDVRFAGSLERPNFTGTLQGRDLALLGGALASLDATLKPGEDGTVRAAISLVGLSWGSYRVEETKLDAVLAKDDLAVEGTALDGRFRLKATGSLAGARPFEATATLDALDLSPFLHAAGIPADVTAKTTGRIRARGTVADLRHLEVETVLDTFDATHPKWGVHADAPVSVVVDRSRVEIRSLRLAGSGLELEATGSLPFEGTGSGRLSLTSSLDLAILLPFVDQLDRASGRLMARLDVAGTLERPIPTGSLSVEDALLDGPEFPTPIEKLAGTVSFHPGEVLSDGVSARIGGGTVSVAGTAVLSEGELRGVDVTLRARDLELESGKDLQVKAGADLAAKGEWPTPTVSGEVRFDDVVYVPSLDATELLKAFKSRKTRRTDAEKSDLPALVKGIALDVAVIARDAIHIEGNLGDAELGGSLRVKGTVGQPVVLGSISSTRGSIYVLGSSFELNRCRLSFSDPHAIDPDLDVSATTTKSEEEITVMIDGRASNAQVLLTSSKGRSQAEIVSILLGGSSGSGSATAELSAAAARMAVRGVASPVLGSLGGRTDLEIVPLPTTPEGEEFLFSVGKDLGGGLTATYYKGVSGETTDAFEMKWRISSRSRGRLRQNQDGSLSGGFRIRRDLD